MNERAKVCQQPAQYLLVTLPGGALDNAKTCMPEAHMMVTAFEGFQAQLQVRACLSPASSSSPR